MVYSWPRKERLRKQSFYNVYSFNCTHLNYSLYFMLTQHLPDRPVCEHLLVCVSSYSFVQWECVCVRAHVCVCVSSCLFRWLRSSHRGVGTWWAEPARGQRWRNSGCQLSDTTLCIHLHHLGWKHTHEKKQPAVRSQMQPGAETNWDGIRLLCLRLFYLFASSPYQRGETEPHAAKEIDDTEGKNRNVAGLMGDAVEWVVGDRKGDTEEMTRQRNDNTDR